MYYPQRGNFLRSLSAIFKSFRRFCRVCTLFFFSLAAICSQVPLITALWAHQSVAGEDTEPSLSEKNSVKEDLTSATIVGDLRRKVFSLHREWPGWK